MAPNRSVTNIFRKGHILGSLSQSSHLDFRGLFYWTGFVASGVAVDAFGAAGAVAALGLAATGAVAASGVPVAGAGTTTVFCVTEGARGDPLQLLAYIKYAARAITTAATIRNMPLLDPELDCVTRTSGLRLPFFGLAKSELLLSDMEAGSSLYGLQT